MNLDAIKKDDIKQAIQDDEAVNLADFLQEVAQQDTRAIARSEVQTKAIDGAALDKNLKKVAGKQVKKHLNKYKALTKIQQQPNMVIDFAPEKLPEPKVVQQDEVDVFLQKAGIQIAEDNQNKEKEDKRSRNYRFDDESSSFSDEPIPDVNDILLNQK